MQAFTSCYKQHKTVGGANWHDGQHFSLLLQNRCCFRQLQTISTLLATADILSIYGRRRRSAVGGEVRDAAAGPEPAGGGAAGDRRAAALRGRGGADAAGAARHRGAVPGAGMRVVYTRHRHRSPADYGMLGEWWPGDLILDGTPDAALLPDIARLPNDPVVDKSTYSAFAGTGDGGGGGGGDRVMTNLCCETTAREAFVRGFRVFFSADATATANRELHEATLKNMAYGFAYLVDCDRLKAAFTRKS
uniref:Isochorismatase-like domain-containing protein n=1 Tax=Ananas comosus var. bracteatus TaxID=296719 RepID=A0A6V7PZA5_ANACO|nr:unnamed protein product [Ananas comosus var. bracteatus]